MARRLHRAHGRGGHGISVPKRELCSPFRWSGIKAGCGQDSRQAEGVRAHVAGDGQANARINMFCAGTGSKSSQPEDVRNGGYLRAVAATSA